MFSFFKNRKRKVINDSIIVLTKILEMNPPQSLKEEIVKKLETLVKEL